MNSLKFTKEIKENWLKALRSGKFLQGTKRLVKYPNVSHSGKLEHCCIGVLGAICDFLDNEDMEIIDSQKNPYTFLELTIGRQKTAMLYVINDDANFNDSNVKQDYSNVIPIIEQLETQD